MNAIIEKIRTEVRRQKEHYYVNNPYNKKAILVCNNILSALGDLEKEEKQANLTIQEPKEQPFKVGDKVSIVEDRKVYKRGLIEKIGTNKNGTPRVIVNTETGSSWIGHPDLLVFDTTQEQPVCEDLKKRASEIYPDKEGDLCSLHSTLQRGGYIRGYQDCKEQMMKGAVSAKALTSYPTDPGNDIFRFDEKRKMMGKFKAGDKVKLIIVKED